MKNAERKLLIGNKNVYQSEPFVPSSNFFSGFVGREPELSLIIASWIQGDQSMPLCPLLIGEPGVGKNRLIYELAQKSGSPLYVFQGHEDVTAEDLACTVRFSDEKANVMDYMLSPLVTAMYHGGICFIDEIGKIRPRALALLVSVLDERRYIDSTLLGERIHAHPAFRFVAATNTTDIHLLPEFILSRMRPQINIGYPAKTEIDDIIRNQCSGMAKSADQLIDLFWMLWKDHSGSLGNVAPRDAIYLFALASKLSAYDAAGGDASFRASNADQPYRFPHESPTTGIRPVHLERAFHRMFTERSTQTG